MKLILIAGPALALSSCAAPTMTSAPRSGPAALPFTGQGTVDLPSVPAAVPIMAGLGNATTSREFTVGTLNPDRTVNISISAEVANAAAARTLANDKATNVCDSSGITVQDAEYVSFRVITFTSAGQKYGAQPGTRVMGADDLRTDTLYQYWYAKSAGSYMGTSRCGARTLTWNIRLSPGWNRIATKDTYNTRTGQRSNSELVSEEATNLYNGPWTSYKL